MTQTRMTRMDTLPPHHPLIQVNACVIDVPIGTVLDDWLKSGWDLHRVTGKKSVEIIHDGMIIRLDAVE